MTDKIIIDGIDVSECGFFHPEYKNTDCHIALAFSEEYGECTKCEQNPNCYYKQLKRKEQECDTLKSQLDFAVQQKECLEQECEELKREIAFGSSGELSDKIRATVFTDLSKENLKYEQALDEIEEYFKSKDKSKTSLFNIFVIEQEILDIINKAKEK